MADSRTYEDRRPFVVPFRLTDLVGPAVGRVELPLAMAWTGRRSYELADRADTVVLYERAMGEASDPDDLSRLLNADLLRSVWPDLYLPRRVRLLWEARFPELVSAA